MPELIPTMVSSYSVVTGRGSKLLYVVFLAGIVGGVLIPIYFFFGDVTPLAWDFLAYHTAAESFVAGEQFVGVRPTVGNGVYVYPPIVVLLFVPYVAFDGWLVPFLVQSVLNLALAVLLGRLIVRTVERQIGDGLSRFDRGSIFAFCLASTYSVIALGQGQVDHAVAVALALGFLWLEQGSEVESGVAFAFAAVIKLFPLLIGIWLLYRRAWRAIAAATVSGLTTIVTSFLVFGFDTNARYFEFVLTERSRVSRFNGSFEFDFFGLTLSRPLSVFVPQLDPAYYPIVAAFLFAPILWVLYRRAIDFQGRLVAFLGTLIAILLVSPASNVNHLLYLYFPLVTLAFTVEHRRSRRLILAGMLVSSFPVHIPQLYWLLELVGLSSAVEQSVMSVVVPVLTVGTVALYGLLLVVAGCVTYALRVTRDPASSECVPRTVD